MPLAYHVVPPAPTLLPLHVSVCPLPLESVALVPDPSSNFHHAMRPESITLVAAIMESDIERGTLRIAATLASLLAAFMIVAETDLKNELTRPTVARRLAAFMIESDSVAV